MYQKNLFFEILYYSKKIDLKLLLGLYLGITTYPHDDVPEPETPEREKELQFERCGDVQVRAEACAHNSLSPLCFSTFLAGCGGFNKPAGGCIMTLNLL